MKIEKYEPIYERYPLGEIINIMKPCKIDSDNENHTEKLNDIMNSQNYIWEEKLDGISMLSIGSRLFGNVISKKTGYPLEKSFHLPHIVKELRVAGGKIIFDGEIYVPGYKSNDVVSITNSNVELAIAKQKETCFLQYWIYDILYDENGTDIRNKPFKERRYILEHIFDKYFLDSEYVILNEVHECSIYSAKKAFDDIISNKGEGIVLKNKLGKYMSGKRPMWNQIKMKASIEDDVIILGFKPPVKLYTGSNIDSWKYWEDGMPVSDNYYKGLIGSITIGKYDSNNDIVEIGSVTGISDEVRIDMTKFPENYIGQVIIIKAMEETEDGKYRHANYNGIHPDKNPFECVI